MAKQPSDQQGIEFQLRPGVDPFGNHGWRGTDTENDPGSMEPNQLLWGENIRIGKGKTIRTRAGLTLRLNLGPTAGAVKFFSALPVDNPRTRLWFSTLGIIDDPVVPGPIVGSAVYHLDPTEDPVVQVHSKFPSAANSQALMMKYGIKIYIGDKTILKELVDITAPPGLSIGEVVPTAATIPVQAFPGFKVRCGLEFDGKLFVGLENLTAPGSSKIVVYDGLAITDDLTGVRPPIAMGIWRDKLVVGFDATAANIRVRNAGGVPGTWNIFAGPAGYVTAAFGNAMQEFRQYLYIASGTDELFRFDGAALTLATTVTGAATDGFGITGVTLHNGLLYYGWNAAVGHAASLGRHDPDSTSTEFVDDYLDLTAAQANFVKLTAVASYRQQIYLGALQSWILATAINDVKGVPEILIDGGSPAAYGVAQLLRFP